MKFLRSMNSEGAPPSYIFQTSLREKALLLATLKLYPMLDAGFHKLSRDPKTVKPADQQLLEGTMANQRLAHKKKLDQFFAGNERFFKESKGELQLILTSEQMEWLLRVLNEIRVGSWVQLGRPDMDSARQVSRIGRQARPFAAMELSGYFEGALLEAF